MATRPHDFWQKQTQQQPQQKGGPPHGGSGSSGGPSPPASGTKALARMFQPPAPASSSSSAGAPAVGPEPTTKTDRLALRFQRSLLMQKEEEQQAKETSKAAASDVPRGRGLRSPLLPGSSLSPPSTAQQPSSASGPSARDTGEKGAAGASNAGEVLSSAASRESKGMGEDKGEQEREQAKKEQEEEGEEEKEESEEEEEEEEEEDAFNWDTAIADEPVAAAPPKTLEELREEARQAALRARQAEDISRPPVPLALRFALPPILGTLDLSGPGRTCTQYHRFRTAFETARGLRTDSTVTLFLCPDVVFLANEVNPHDYMLLHQPFPRAAVTAVLPRGRAYADGRFFKVLLGEGAAAEEYVLVTSGLEETQYWMGLLAPKPHEVQGQ